MLPGLIWKLRSRRHLHFAGLLLNYCGVRTLWSRLSIRRKLSLLIGGLVLVVAATYSWAAYGGMRRAALTTARMRLRSVTEQLAVMLQTSGKQLVTVTRTSAADTAVRDFLKAPGPRTRQRALVILQRSGPQAQQIATIRLRGPSGGLLLDVPLHGTPVSALADTAVLRAATGPDSGAVGSFRAVGDSVVYPVAAAVVERGRLLGYMVVWRWVSSSPQARDRTNQLIGAKSALYVGNAAGDVWTDLAAAVPPPPAGVRDASGLLTYERAGTGSLIAAASPIVGVPWTVRVEFPRAEVFAPARLFLRQLALIALAVLLVALTGAWAVSRSMAGPLLQLTGAAEAIAAGDYSRRIQLDRRDELGRLEEAFTTMARNVQDAQRRLEDKVRERTAELQDRNEELEAFGYSISHDLRAPLRAMFGFSQALLEDYGDRLDATGREYAERIVTGARAMDEMIQDLLAYSKLSRAELKLGRVDLTRVLRDAATQLQAEIRSRGARLSVEDPLPAVVGHAATLAQVVTNLLANGIKFVPPGRSADVRVRAESRDGRVRLCVEDNGIGVAAEHHERIFHVFERLHPVETYPGTGIGLAIVRKGMERMGGRAGVESRPGEGSVFWIELPAAERAHERERQYDSAG